MEENEVSKIAFVSFVIGGIVFGILVFLAMPGQIVYEEKEQPMLMVEFIDWAENEDDSSESLFNYFIYNFGNIEAKNVSIRCEITDAGDNILKKEIYQIGNIASNAHELLQSNMYYPIAYSDNEFGACYLESANGEYVNLFDRLDDLE